MAVVVGFHGSNVRCELAQRGVRRGVAEASGSDGVQRVSEAKVTWKTNKRRRRLFAGDWWRRITLL